MGRLGFGFLVFWAIIGLPYPPESMSKGGGAIFYIMALLWRKWCHGVEEVRGGGTFWWWPKTQHLGALLLSSAGWS